jgi:formate--tetrahydrofolate ligase
VTSVRALKTHGSGLRVAPGRALPARLLTEDVASVARSPNLLANLAILRRFDVPTVVALNAFPEDTAAEHRAVIETAQQAGARAVVCRPYCDGSEGTLELAEAVAEAAARPGGRRLLYEDRATLETKIDTVAREIYGAAAVSYDPAARAALDALASSGFSELPVCVAKTHLSLSHDPRLLGAPREYVFPVRDVRLFAGAGFVSPVAGDIVTMPGLGREPLALRLDLDDAGNIVGL